MIPIRSNPVLNSTKYHQIPTIGIIIRHKIDVKHFFEKFFENALFFNLKLYSVQIEKIRNDLDYQ